MWNDGQRTPRSGHSQTLPVALRAFDRPQRLFGPRLLYSILGIVVPDPTAGDGRERRHEELVPSSDSMGHCDAGPSPTSLWCTKGAHSKQTSRGRGDQAERSGDLRRHRTHSGKARHLLDVTLRRAFFIVVAALTLCVCAALPSSSSVLAVSLEQLSTASQLIFEGEVVGMTSDFNANQTSIHTYVTFRVVDVVKGTYTQPEITLRFLGGTVGEIGVNVSDSTLPELGETGIYFVESLERFQVNPLYGMDQGHFLIFESGSQRIMMTRNRRVITAFLSDDQPPADGLSNGIARGLSINEDGASPSGVTVFQFKQTVRQYSRQLP